MEAIRCWWRWLPKEDVEVREGGDEEEQGSGQDGAGGSGQQQRKGGAKEGQGESGDRVQVVSNVLSRAIYSAMVVAVSMVGGVGWVEHMGGVAWYGVVVWVREEWGGVGWAERGCGWVAPWP